MTALLVSVRSAVEARSALAGGAAVIDIKEPARGPLGRADAATWQAVCETVPTSVPVSVALGELVDWRAVPPPEPSTFAGLSFRKVGLAGAGPGWAEEWARLRRAWGVGPPWVAVAYADWVRANAPEPDAVLAASRAADCAGILVDTWDKAHPSPLDLTWRDWVARAREAGLLVALAGGLDGTAIDRLAPLRPDLFAVRGAACVAGRRDGTIDSRLVADLVVRASARPTTDRADSARSRVAAHG